MPFLKTQPVAPPTPAPKAPKEKQAGKKTSSGGKSSSSGQKPKLDVTEARAGMLPLGPEPEWGAPFIFDGKVWAFCQTWLFPKDNYYLAVRWADRGNRMVPRVQIPCDQITRVIKLETVDEWLRREQEAEEKANASAGS